MYFFLCLLVLGPRGLAEKKSYKKFAQYSPKIFIFAANHCQKVEKSEFWQKKHGY